MYSVGDIQGINCSLGQNDHRIPHHLPMGTGQSQPSMPLTHCQSVHQSIWLAGPRRSCLSRSLTLSPLSVWCGIHIMTAWPDREGDGKVTLISKACIHTNSWACTLGNTLTHTNTNSQMSTLYFTRLTFVGYTWDSSVKTSKPKALTNILTYIHTGCVQ